MNRQQHKLALYLFGSILIHLSMAIALSRRQLPVSVDVAEITPITMVESQSSSDREPKTKSDPKPQAKKTTPAAAEKPPAPPPLATEPKTKPPAPAPKPLAAAKTTPPPTPPSTPVATEPEPKPKPPASIPKPDPPLLTSTESNAFTQPDAEPEIEKLIRANEAKRKNLEREKSVLDRIEQTTPEQPQLPQATNRDRELLEPKPESEKITEQSLDSTLPSKDTETEPESNPTSNDVSENGKETEQNETSTATNDIYQESKPLSITCEANCQPEYPDALDGVEGSAGISLTINRDGKVIGATIAVSNGNTKLDQEALKAAQEMEFSSLDRDRAVVQINITFALAN